MTDFIRCDELDDLSFKGLTKLELEGAIEFAKRQGWKPAEKVKVKRWLWVELKHLPHDDEYRQLPNFMNHHELSDYLKRVYGQNTAITGTRREPIKLEWSETEFDE